MNHRDGDGGGARSLIAAPGDDATVSERLLYAAFENALDAIVIADAAGRWVAANQAAVELFGRPLPELLGKTPGSFADATFETDTAWRRFVDEGEQRGLFPVRRPDGTSRLLEYAAKSDVLPGYHLSILKDVTDAYERDQATKRSEARFRSLSEKSTDMTFVADRDGVFVFASASARSLLGLAPEALLGRSAFDIVHPDDLATARATLADVLAEPDRVAVVVLRVRGGDGAFRDLEITARNLLHDPAVGGIAANARDVTERVRAERELQESELRYRRIVEEMSDGLVQVDGDGRITFMNARLGRMLGVDPAACIGRDILAYVHETSRPLAEAARERRRQLHAESYEIALRRQDGAPLHVEARAVALKSERGAFDGVLALIADVEERRRLEDERQQNELELRRVENQLRQSQKMEAIGRLAGGIAHDFNNMLSVILTYGGFLAEKARGDDELRADVEQVVEAAERASTLTRQLLTFSRQRANDVSVVDVNRSIEGLAKLVGRVIGEDIAVSLRLSPTAARVRVDAAQLEQVIMNLVVNARDAMPNGGTLSVETAHVELDDSFASRHVGVSPGRYVMIAVSDTGVGMSAETQARLFEPFFTTKPAGKGTGLGLATVFGIVQQHGGTVWAYSEVGKGTSMKVYLPSTEAPVHTAARDGDADVERGNGVVLLAEDDDDVRAAARAILSRAGYTVLEAATAGDALMVSESYEGRIHLLLTDVVMPRIDGKRLAERLRHARPEMAVMYMSGYTEDVVVHHGVGASKERFLQKPFTARTLTSKVRLALDP